MKRILFILAPAVFVFSFIFSVSSVRAEEVSVGLPKIISVSPTDPNRTGINRHDKIKIIGENFGGVYTGEVVLDGNLMMHIQSWSDTRIEVQVDGAGDLPLFVRSNQGGVGNLVDSNIVSIRILQDSPKIISITPKTIKPQGTTVEIVGENFGATQATYSGKLFYINGATDSYIQSNHDILSWTDTRIKAIINLADVPWDNLVPPGSLWSFLQVRVKCIDSVCNNYVVGQGLAGRPSDEYWSEANNFFPITIERPERPKCTSWTYSDWSVCGSDKRQNRYVLTALPAGCIDGVPILYQSCTYTPPPCTTWAYSDWSSCSANGEQTRTIITSKPVNCVGGDPIVKQSCIYTPPCTEDKWSCGEWNTCSVDGRQSRSCAKDFDCPSVNTPSPNTTQACTPPKPVCYEDKWECGGWSTCSLDGVQRRTCRRTYDCSDVESEVPQTSQSCDVPVSPRRNIEPPQQPPQQQQLPATTTDDTINRDQILKATVKLVCPINKSLANQGSGTVIDSYGSILTNRHVIAGTIGSCHVGFIQTEDDTPVFSEIADVKNVSLESNQNGDMAIVKIRNNTSKQFTAIDISRGDSNTLRSGDTILPFGYPKEEDFGETITFTEGPYSGKGTTITVGGRKYNVGGFFKTTATIEHGNSGGGAYQKKNGYFMGIPTLGVNKVNYILSVNRIKSWINSFNKGYSISANNFGQLYNYYSTPIEIEDISLSDLHVLDSAKPAIAIYADKGKKKLLVSEASIYNSRTPTFLIIGDRTVAGYYIYFGTNRKANPLKSGKFSTNAEYTPPAIKKAGTYYLIVKAKDETGKIGDAIVTEYRYKK